MDGTGGGVYTEIVAIIAPDNAVAGATVDVEVQIKNISTEQVHVYCIGVRDSAERFIDWLEAWLGPGSVQSFHGSFIMPNEDVIVNIYTYYRDAEGYLHSEESLQYPIKVIVTPQFGGFSITDYSKV